MSDRSNGWEAVAAQLIELRSPTIGVSTLHRWIASLPVPGAVVDLGCGAGIPVSEALVNAGFDVYGIDAAPSLVAAFRQRFPTAHAACETVEDSPFFDRSFDAAVAIGLLFLLVSLGIDGYKAAIDDAGLTLVGEYLDEGENHYYDARKDEDFA